MTVALFGRPLLRLAAGEPLVLAGRPLFAAEVDAWLVAALLVVTVSIAGEEGGQELDGARV